MRKKTFSLLCLLTVAVVAVPLTGTQRPAPGPAGEDLPPEFMQLLPRGRIASVDAPQFVQAEKAKIPDDAWVMGVVINGQARAYSLNLLNRHEVVNDEVGGVKFAAVW